MPRSERRALRGVLVALAVSLALAAGYLWGQRRAPAQKPERPSEQLADTATVLVAVRGLARLESVEFHMERIVDLKNRQPRLFGLFDAEDEIILVAAGEVIAGIDFAKMRDGDVIATPSEGRVRLALPPPEILSVRLDNERTYVHTRKTDLLARRGEHVETRARQIAERSIRSAALDAGILHRAGQSAEHTLSLLVRALGYDQVIVSFAER